MNEDKYISKISKKPLFRGIAWLGLIIIALLVVATLITGVTGSKYFIGCLFLCIVVPVFMYVILWIGKVLNSMNEPDSEDQVENTDKK